MDRVIMPKELTAENGAKEHMSGEFYETVYIQCPECYGDGLIDGVGDECEDCNGRGGEDHKVHVSWTNIKAIYAMAEDLFSQPID